MAPSLNENKQRMADEINAILKTKIHWEKLSMEDLGSIYTLITTGSICYLICPNQQRLSDVLQRSLRGEGPVITMLRRLMNGGEA